MHSNRMNVYINSITEYILFSLINGIRGTAEINLNFMFGIV